MTMEPGHLPQGPQLGRRAIFERPRGTRLGELLSREQLENIGQCAVMGWGPELLPEDV